jgi:Dolichyl-phosphate-mannose-protein mannosyltransferase
MTTRHLILVAGLGVAGLMAWMTSAGEESLAGVVVFGLLTLCGMLLLTRGGAQTRRPVGLFLLAFGIRSLAGLALYQCGLVNVIGEPDAEAWSWGWAQAEVWRGHIEHAGSLPPSILGAFSGANRGYIYLCAMMLFPLGIPSRLAIAFMNSFFGGLTVVLVFMTAERLFDREIARIAGVLAAFFPSLIIWSAQTLKEPVVIFCECLILYAVVRLREGFSLRHLFYALAGVILVSTMRFYVTYIALGVVGLALLMPQTGISRRHFAAGLLFILLAFPILKGLGFLEGTGEQMGSFDLKYVEHYRNVTSMGKGAGSGVRTDIDVTTPGGAALATVIGMAHLMLAPFPWQLGNASIKMLMTLPELLIWWWLFFSGVVPGLIHAVRTRFSAVQPVLLFIVPLSILYGMIFANIGLAFRYRASLLPFYLMFAALGLVIRRRRRSERWIERLQSQAEASNRWRQRRPWPRSLGTGSSPRDEPVEVHV